MILEFFKIKLSFIQSENEEKKKQNEKRYEEKWRYEDKKKNGGK